MNSYKHFMLVFGIFLLCGVLGEKPTPEEIKERRYTKGEDRFIFDACY
jgi:hypothetical protein